jgi:hypothetical protein
MALLRDWGRHKSGSSKRGNYSKRIAKNLIPEAG